MDDIRREHKILPADKKKNGQIIQLAKEKAKVFLRAKQDFVFNATNITRDIRNKWISLFTDYGARVKIIYIEVPYRTLLKQNQEHVLAIWLRKSDFDALLAEAVHSSYQEAIYGTQETWKAALADKEVRLQWDPDHNPYGEKQVRRAIQLGMKGAMLERFGKEMVTRIEDITDFVQAQKSILNTNIVGLQVPSETIYVPQDMEICKQIGLD